MSNGNNNGHRPNGTEQRPRPRQRQRAQARRRNRHRARAALGRASARRHAKALGQPLDPALVSQRKGRGGRTFDYLEGHVVIDRANEIFGFGGWGYELLGDVTLRTIETVDPQTGEIRTAKGYSAPVRVTVAGALPRTDVGVHPVTEDNVDGHDMAIKAAVTDGMKRAFRSFGRQFGNSLYGDQQPVVGQAKPQRVPAQAEANGNAKPAQAQPKGRSDSRVETLRKRLMELCVKQGFDEDQVQAAVQRETGKGIDDLTTDELGPLIKAAANKLNQIRQAQAA